MEQQTKIYVRTMIWNKDDYKAQLKAIRLKRRGKEVNVPFRDNPVYKHNEKIWWHKKNEKVIQKIQLQKKSS